MEYSGIIKAENSSVNLTNSTLTTNITAQGASQAIYGNNSSIKITNSNISTTTPLGESSIDQNNQLIVTNNNLTIENSSINTIGMDTIFGENATIHITKSNIYTSRDRFINTITVFDSKLTITDSTLITDKINNLIQLGKSNLILYNVTVDASNVKQSTFINNIAESNSTISIKNSNISTVNGFEASVIEPYLGLASNIDAQIENSTLNFTNIAYYYDGNITLQLNNSTLLGSQTKAQIGSDGYQFNLILDNRSSYTGDLRQDTGIDTSSSISSINVTMNQGSTWNVGSSEINNLNANNSTIKFEEMEMWSGSSYVNKLIIKNNLSGAANFIFNTDLAQQKSNLLRIEGTATGNHTVEVKNSGQEPTQSGGKVTLVQIDNPSTALFKLKDRDYVDVGAYRYSLLKKDKNWVLSNTATIAPTALNL